MTVSETSSLVQALVALLGVVGALVAFFGWLYDRHMQRLAEAVRTVTEFSRNLRPDLRAVRDLLEVAANNEHDSECIDHIIHDEKTVLPPKCYALLEIIFPGDFISQSNASEISMSAFDSRRLRLLGLDYLNQIEVALLPWRYCLADRHILEAELNYLRKDKKTHLLCEFRKEVLNTYPAILAFETCEQPSRQGLVIALVSAFRHFLLYPYCCCHRHR